MSPTHPTFSPVFRRRWERISPFVITFAVRLPPIAIIRQKECASRALHARAVFTLAYFLPIQYDIAFVSLLLVIDQLLLQLACECTGAISTRKQRGLRSPACNLARGHLYAGLVPVRQLGKSSFVHAEN